jgi:phosphoglycerate dehydrogenase-like enzyme
MTANARPLRRIAVLDDYQGAARMATGWNSLPPDSEVVFFDRHIVKSADLIDRLQGFEVVCAMRERTEFSRSLFERLPDLRFISTTGIRNAAIDIVAARDHGVVVSGTFAAGNGTAELTWGLIISAARHISVEDAAIRSGSWQTSVGADLQGRVIGILGLGKIGGHVARVARVFGMEVLAWSQNLTAEVARAAEARLVDKDDLFRQSDILTIHLVLSERTRGLVGSRELGLMKPTSILVNTSRGPIVDEQALAVALAEGRLRAAALDVFQTEPLPMDHPFRSLRNLVMTPHIGYVTESAYRRFFLETIENIQAYFDGNPVRVIDPPS